MSQRRLTATLLVTLLVCLLAGGIGAYFLGQYRSESTAATPPPVRHTVTRTAVVTATEGGSSGPTSDSSADPGTDDGGVTDSPTGGEPSARPPSTAPSRSTETRQRDPEDTVVQLSDQAAQDPEADQVRDLMQRHFDAINAGDYKLWAGTVTNDQVMAIPSERWAKEYSTTKDSGATIVQIDTRPRQARVSFRSRQSADFAPDKKSTCVDWNVTLPLTEADGGVVIGRSNESLARYRPCEG